MRTKRIIKRFDFDAKSRPTVILGAGVRLSIPDNRLQLQEDSDGYYSTDPDLYAKTRVSDPSSAKQWLGFQVSALNKRIDGEIVTELNYRLSDGTDEYYWNGASWAVSTTQWNTEAEVADHISTFPINDSRKIQVVVNLKTSDRRATPEVYWIKVLYASDLDELEDLVYRSLVPSLREGIRPIAELFVQQLATGTTIDLDNHPVDTPYNVAGIDSVYNKTDDPSCLEDLFSSYNPTTKVITLSSSIEEDKLVRIRFLYEPVVAVTTHSFYHELGKVPTLVLDDIALVNASRVGWNDAVVNVSNNTAVKVPGPIQGDLEISMLLSTDKGVDHMRLAKEVARYFGNTPMLRSVGLDEDYSLWLIEEYNSRLRGSREDIHVSGCRFRVRSVVLWHEEAVDSHGVERLVLSGSLNITI